VAGGAVEVGSEVFIYVYLESFHRVSIHHSIMVYV